MNGGMIMKNILVFIIDSINKQTLTNTIRSLTSLESQIIEIQCLTLTEKKSLKDVKHPLLRHTPLLENDLGNSLNHAIQQTTATKLLFLYGSDYIKREEEIFLKESHPILYMEKHYRQLRIDYPIFVQTRLLKDSPFHQSKHLIFQEAIFPLWLSNHGSPRQISNIKSSRINTSRSEMEKQQIINTFSTKKQNKRSPTISVLISTYNAAPFINTAIQSAYLQNEMADEILIMDDGSIDETPLYLQTWKNTPSIKLYHQKNRGKAPALNQLLSHVTSEFILELDADDWLDYNAISTIKDCLQELHSHSVLLYGNYRKWKQQSENNVLFIGHAKGKQVHHKQQLLQYQFPLGPRIYRTSTLKSINGFPTIHFEEGRLYEDVSVLQSLLEQGSLTYSDMTIYNVRKHSQSITKNNHSKWQEYLKIINNNTNQ